MRVVENDARRLLARNARLSWNVVHPHRRRELTPIVGAQGELDVGAIRAARRPDGGHACTIGSERRVSIRAVRHSENDAFAGLVPAADRHGGRRDATDGHHFPQVASHVSRHASGRSASVVQRISERGARLARRDD